MDLFSYFKVPVVEASYLERVRDFGSSIEQPIRAFVADKAENVANVAQLVYSTISENWQHLNLIDGHQVIPDSMVFGAAGAASALLGCRAVKNYRNGHTLTAVAQAPLAGLAALGALHTLAGLSREAMKLGTQTA